MNRKFKISLYLAAIFAAGMVTGLFISYQVARHMMPSQERMASRWCGELESKLDLTPDQLRNARPAINKALADFRADLTRDMLAGLSNCYTRVEQELTPDQKAKLHQLREKQEQFIRSQVGGEISGSGK
jgi:hypothetical protein